MPKNLYFAAFEVFSLGNPAPLVFRSDCRLQLRPASNRTDQIERTDPMKQTTINAVDFSLFRAFAAACDGSFCQAKETVTARSMRIDLTIPRFKGEKITAFFSHFDGSERLGEDGATVGKVALSKTEKDFLRSIFDMSDAAMAEANAEAGRVEFTARYTAGKGGTLDIGMQARREMASGDCVAEIEQAIAETKAALKANAAANRAARKAEAEAEAQAAEEQAARLLEMAMRA